MKIALIVVARKPGVQNVMHVVDLFHVHKDKRLAWMGLEIPKDDSVNGISSYCPFSYIAYWSPPVGHF